MATCTSPASWRRGCSASTGGNTRGPIHTCDGQEAVGIGVTAVLTFGREFDANCRIDRARQSGAAVKVGPGLRCHETVTCFGYALLPVVPWPTGRCVFYADWIHHPAAN